ncbi:Predicted arabinose efflux permease, MFS family [Saccharopolyspora kobensis]|uniref:Predicted arabinose efflux permease, MFS family n=1 Tax=Saccharopolyspora kobensis TaxID=146035 RepID=A0A1H6EH23_9PSEU|nr:Predicted arabinose efflux permease, MFS family [Saccharopolyspora kobensis]SFE66966.1 Predicted arabinose efflux permease, MFS family [Saccharopolyspora kobensis]
MVQAYQVAVRASVEPRERKRTPLQHTSFRLLLVATVGGFAGYILLMPVLPLWAVVGGAGEIAAGATNAVFMLVTVITQLCMPWLLKRIDHRIAFGLGTILIGLPTPLYALSSDLWLLLAVSSVRGIGFGLLTVTGAALVAELVPVEQRGRAAALYGLSIGLPNVIFLPVGVWLTQQIGFTPLFWIAGVLPVAATTVLFGMSRVQAREPAGKASAMTFPLALLPSWTVMTAVAVGAGGILAFLPLAIGESVAPAALMTFGAATMLGRWGAGQLGDRIGQHRILVPSVLLAGLGAGLLAVAAWGADPIALLGAVAFGCGFGAVQNTTLVMMFERTSSGVASTAWNIAYDAGQGLGSLGFGILIALSGYPLTFVIMAVLIGACAPLAFGRRRG